MQTVVGSGCWPGQAEGPVVWVRAGRKAAGAAITVDRATEVLRFRAEVARALEQLEAWTEQQPSLEGRVLLQGYREALSEEAWVRRACALIDGQGAAAPLAALEAADAITNVLARSEELHERVESLRVAAEWLAGRLAGTMPPQGAIVAADELSPLELLDLSCPALLAGGEPLVTTGQPLVWGVPDLGPHWHDRRVALNGCEITLDVPDPRWWPLVGDRLGDLPICHLDGDLEAVARMARHLGQAPVAMVRRVEDLAAVPLFVRTVAGVALDLDRMGPKLWKHPGVRLLMEAAIRAGGEAGVPVLAGGVAAAQEPDVWLALGFTALFARTIPRGGQHALRRDTESGM